MNLVQEDENNLVFIVDRQCDRLEDYLMEKDISGRLFRKVYKNKHISVNGKFKRKDLSVKEGDIINVYMEDEFHTIERQAMELDIVYEDMDILIINKGPNMVVHPTKSHQLDTLSNGISHYFYSKDIKRKIRLVNRLDMDTSGLLIVAKNPYAHQQMSLQFDEGKVIRKYMTLVSGIVEKDSEIIDLPIGREEEDSIRKEVNENGQEARTKYEVIKRYDNLSLLDVELFTGRSHQIRVHLSHIGHPLIGDTLYGKEDEILGRQALHSYYLEFSQPRTKEKIVVKSELPLDILDRIDHG